jgi:hypothetical protein
MPIGCPLIFVAARRFEGRTEMEHLWWTRRRPLNIPTTFRCSGVLVYVILLPSFIVEGWWHMFSLIGRTLPFIITGRIHI